jgi:UDP-N-acetylmuramate--alanine ligase
VTRSYIDRLFRTPDANTILTALDLTELARGKSVHFMGIGGAGMSPLAELVRRSGGRVTGCDAHPGAAVEPLLELGIPVADGHDPDHVRDCSALVVTSAVPADHPEILAARRAGIPVVKRAEALGSIVNRGTVVGISGTHGKTTTTALTTAALAAGGLDPTGLVGGRVAAWGRNLRLGSDRLFVVEADEYDRSFHTLRPSIAVVTTLEADHLDVYGTLEGVETAFAEFLDRVTDDGLVLGCGDDPGVGRLLARVARPRGGVVTYGLSAGSMLRAEQVGGRGTETTFRVREAGRPLGEVRLRVPGLHNVRNALAAIGAARRLGVAWDDIVEGLSGYTGVARRFERVGEAAGALLVDDYAHHPTEIEATLAAARTAYPERRLVVAFQPHLYSRTRDFAPQFGRALARADLVFVTGIYAARERPIPGVTEERIVDEARAAGAEVVHVADRTALPGAIAAALASNDLCLTLGAGDLDRAAREVLALLSAADDAQRGAR